MKNKLIFNTVSIGICLMVLSACQLRKTEDKQAEAVCVKTVRIEDMSSIATRNYVGSIEEKSSTALSFGLGGYVKQVMVTEGQFVRKGELLATLDKTNAQNTYNAAKAALAQAEDGYRRLKQVYDQGSLAEVKWVEMQTDLEKARSMEKIAAKSLKDCDLTAPFSGFVGTCHAQSGMNLLPVQPAITLLDIDEVKVKFTVPENEVINLKLGKTAHITIAALDNKVYTGKLTERGVVADALSHSYTMKITLPNPNRELLPGMVCKIEMADEEAAAGCMIPAHAVQTGMEGTFVWLVRDGKAVRQNVVVEAFSADGVIITEGLQMGDEVITEGYLKIGEGSEITNK